MKLLQLGMAAAMAAAVMVGPYVASAQALGEAGALGAGLSSVGSASGSALSNGISRTLTSEGRRVNSSRAASNSGGVTNLHWSREELKRSEQATGTHWKARNTKVKSGKPQPDFVIFGADPPNADSEDAPVTKPKAARPSASQPKATKDKDKGSHPGEKSLAPASH